jgi:hypothetical protein
VYQNAIFHILEGSSQVKRADARKERPMTSGLSIRVSTMRRVFFILTAVVIGLIPQESTASCDPDEFCVNYDTSSSATTGSSTSTTLTWTHIMANGENRAIVVGVSIRHDGAGVPPSVTSITYGGEDLTYQDDGATDDNSKRAEIWGLSGDDVPTGSNSVVVTVSSTAQIVGGAVTFTGVDPSSSFQGTSSDGDDEDAAGLAYFNAAETSVLVGVGAVNADITATVAETGQVERWNSTTSVSPPPTPTPTPTPASVNLRGFGSTRPGQGGFFSLQSWDLGSSTQWAAAGLEVKPFNDTLIRLAGFRASAQGAAGVVLDWRTGGEVGTLGYRLYRQDAEGMEHLVNRSLVAGSSLLTRSTLEAGYSYRWVDRKGALGDRYWLEEVQTDGGTRRYGPFPVVPGDDQAQNPRSSRTLSEINDPGAAGEQRSVLPFGFPRLPKSTPNSGLQQALAADGNAIKIGVERRGWYRIKYSALAAAGLPGDVDPTRLQLFTEGTQVPIRVTGASDGTFGPGDVLHFYGVGLDEQLTDTRVYWLVEGDAAGMRIPAAGGGEVGTSIATLPNTLELLERLVYVASFANGDEGNFFGAVLASDPVERTFAIDQLDVASAQMAVLDVALRGFSEGAHSVDVELNGSYVATVAGHDQDELHEVVEVPVSSLVEGDNAVRLTPSGGGDITLVDTIRLQYPRHTAATVGEFLVAIPDDATAFAIERTDGFVGHRVFDDGFESGDFNGWAMEAEAALVLDVSDPFAVVDLTASAQGRVDTVSDPGADRPGQGKVQAGSGETQQLLQFHMPAGTDRAVHAIAPGQSLSPAWVVSNTPSTVTETAAAADAVFVAPRDFLTALEPLVAYRQSEGYDTLVVAIEDVYDEQTFGMKQVEAVQNLMTALSDRWGVPPQYLILVGDASYDPRNYLGLGNVDLIPTKFVATRSFEAASDDWFGDVTGDGEPDMVVARLPVSTSTALGELVSKTLAYEQDETAWSKGLFVSDEDMGQQFEMSNLKLIGLVPSMATEQVLVRELGPEGARTAVVNAINSGVDLVNYVGHGSVQSWSGDVLAVDALGMITNTADPAIFTMMNCMNGYFFDAALDSLAEALLTHPSGAVAVFASTGITGWAPQEDLMVVFYDLMENTTGGLTLGQAVHEAKAASQVEEIRRTWVLLGDPMIRVR